MNCLNTLAVFCEDIREEKAGTESLMGVWSDNLSVEAVPAAIPKFCFFVRIHIPVDMEPEVIKCAMIEPDGKRVELTEFQSDLKKSSREDALKLDAPYYSLVTRGVAAPFNIQRAGRFQLMVEIDGEVRLAGSLNVIVSGGSPE